MEDPVVELKTGFIRGVVENHEDGFNYYAFKGVPYGELPVGELRFCDPIPKKKWEGTLDCNNYGPVVFQHDLFTGEDFYSEDALNLNVYTHSINQLYKNRPVMLLIHAGDYSCGRASSFYCGPNYLIRKDIVLVIPEFRVGILGFLDTEDEIAPGNQGLKDIVLSLQWVQENIRVFGGDPNNVTVFGMSSGSASAHYLALSPLTKGLMHKVLCQNVNVYTPWAARKNPKANAIKICSLLGKDLVDSKDIVEFLRTVDTKMLLQAQQELRKIVRDLTFGPGVDSHSPNPVVPIERYKAAAKGVHLPYLTGYNSHSGLVVLLDFEKIFLFNGQEILTGHDMTVEQFRRLYYKSEKVSTDNLEKFVDLTSDIYFTESIEKMARVQSEQSSAPTYLYRFSYESPTSLTKLLIKNIPNGAGYLDELPYLFKLDAAPLLGLPPLKKGTRDYKLMEQLTEMWTNFATYGRPTIETSDLIPVHWKPIADGTLLRYLNIDADLTMQYTVNVDQKFLSAKRSGCLNSVL